MKAAFQWGRAVTRVARMTGVLLAAMGQLSGGWPVKGQGAASSEYSVKAAFLFHFAQFVEWPEDSFRDAASPLVYCTAGFDPFRGTLDAALSGKTVEGRGFEVRHLKQGQEAQGCHLLFVGEEQKR